MFGGDYPGGQRSFSLPITSWWFSRKLWHILQRLKSLPFHTPEARKRYPFRAEPPCRGHYRGTPPPRMSIPFHFTMEAPGELWKKKNNLRAFSQSCPSILMNFFSEPQTINIDNVTALLHDVCTAIAESVGAVKRSELANHLTMQKWPHVLLGFNLALPTL